MFVIPVFVTFLSVPVNRGHSLLYVIAGGTHSYRLAYSFYPPPCLPFLLRQFAAGYIHLLIADILSA
jgi:hypothetical protein